jgi:hypothetical protein
MHAVNGSRLHPTCVILLYLTHFTIHTYTRTRNRITPTPAALSPSERSALSSAVSAQSVAVEHSGGLSLLKAVHSAFPLAQIDSYSDVLLRRGKSSKVRISRIFKSDDHLRSRFRSAQDTFKAVLRLGLAVSRPAKNAIDFGGAYSGCAFEEIEIDCLLKVAAPVDIRLDA